MSRAILPGCILALLLCATLPAHASGILLDFRGLKDQEAVDNFYNGGTGGDGSTRGYNFGITFSSNTLALKSFLQAGSGNFVTPPLGAPAIFFGASNGIMNSSAGFNTGIQFFYAAGATATVTVYSGVNGQGSALATITLSPNAGGSCGGASFCTWTSASLGFTGTAESVVFHGSLPNQFGVSEVTVGSTQSAIPEPSSFLLVGTGLVGLYGSARSRLARPPRSHLGG